MIVMMYVVVRLQRMSVVFVMAMAQAVQVVSLMYYIVVMRTYMGSSLPYLAFQ